MNSRATHRIDDRVRGLQAFCAAKTLVASKRQPVYYKIVLPRPSSSSKKPRFFSLTNVWISMEATSYVHEIY